MPAEPAQTVSDVVAALELIAQLASGRYNLVEFIRTLRDMHETMQEAKGGEAARPPLRRASSL